MTAPRADTRGALAGAIISAAFAVAWAMWGASGLSCTAAAVIRIVALLAGLALIGRAMMLRRSGPRATDENSMFATTEYRWVVAVEGHRSVRRRCRPRRNGRNRVPDRLVCAGRRRSLPVVRAGVLDRLLRRRHGSDRRCGGRSAHRPRGRIRCWYPRRHGADRRYRPVLRQRVDRAVPRPTMTASSRRGCVRRARRLSTPRGIWMAVHALLDPP